MTATQEQTDPTDSDPTKREIFPRLTPEMTVIGPGISEPSQILSLQKK